MLGSASNDTVPLLLTLALGCLLGPLLLAHAVHRRKDRHLRRVGRQREVSRYLNTLATARSRVSSEEISQT